MADIRTKSSKRTARLMVDHAMAAVLLAVILTPFDWGMLHEWLGIAFFALFIVHHVLNYRWWKALPRGRWNLRRVLSTLVDLAMIVCIGGLFWSSLVLSRYAFVWLPSMSGSSLARVWHLACSYWLFVLAYVHAGAHLRLDRKKAWQPIALLAGLVLGAFEFVRLGVGDYLFLRAVSVAQDSTIPPVLTLARYVLLACGCMAVGCGVHALLTGKRKGEKR